MQEAFPLKKFFFEKTFSAIAIYKINKNKELSELTPHDLIFIDVNPAYERVNKIEKNKLIGKSFADVWPTVEPCWSDIIVDCLKTGKPCKCESISNDTGTYLNASAFPLSENMAAVFFIDQTEIRKKNKELEKKQKKLTKYQNKLRELATQLTLTEEDTRREIATEIHDSIGHTLLTLLLDLRNMQEFRTEIPDFVNKRIETSIKATEEMISETRELILQLSPPILLEVGLTPAIETLADHILTRNNVNWDVTTRGTMDEFNADDNVCIILYRMTRELLVNVIKHAEATKVSIIINRGPGKIQVVVEDDGKGLPHGFKLGRSTSPGLGLFSIRERLLYIGGDMQIISSDTGTTVSIISPLKILPVKEDE